MVRNTNYDGHNYVIFSILLLLTRANYTELWTGGHDGKQQISTRVSLDR